jgi:hypothetical protein
MNEYGFTLQDVDRINSVKYKIEHHIHTMYYLKWSKFILDNKKHFYLTGGAIASLIRNEKPKDWDFYCDDSTVILDFMERIKLFYMGHVKEVDEKYQEFVGQDGRMITAKATTMEDDSSFITFLTGTPEQIKKSFDFVHCMAHYNLEDGKLHISKKVFDAAMNKKLIVNNGSMVKDWRIQKFIDQGYTYEK